MALSVPDYMCVPEDAAPAAPAFVWPPLPTHQHKISRTVAQKCIPFPLRVFRHGIDFDKESEQEFKHRCLKKLRAAGVVCPEVTAKQRSEIEFFLANATHKNCAIRHIHGETSAKHNNWLQQVASAAADNTLLYEDITAKPDGRPQLTFVIVYNDCVHAAAIRPGMVYCVFYTTGK